MDYDEDFAEHDGILTGDVFYRERMALRPDALITVRLEDITRGTPRLLGDQIIRARGQQVPIPFNISYDPAHITPDQRIVVTARIDDAQGHTLFKSRGPIPVITGYNPSSGVQVMLVRASEDE
jgi:putative lipoprotein